MSEGVRERVTEANYFDTKMPYNLSSICMYVHSLMYITILLVEIGLALMVFSFSFI